MKRSDACREVLLLLDGEREVGGPGETAGGRGHREVIGLRGLTIVAGVRGGDAAGEACGDREEEADGGNQRGEALAAAEPGERKREERQGDGRVAERLEGRAGRWNCEVSERGAAVTAKATGVAPEPVAMVAGVRVPVTLVGRPEKVRVMGPGSVVVMIGVTARE